MITIVVGTNRAHSVSAKIAKYYQDLLNEQGAPNQILDLANLPPDFVFSALYENNGKNTDFNHYSNLVNQSEKFVFIVPEYNGSFPGVLKAFIDGLKFPDAVRGKKCALVGISSGMQGSIIAMSHLTDIFNYLGMHVMALKVKLAFIKEHFDGQTISHELYARTIRQQAEQLIAF
jgi:chromate reductase, NAD(P)H dehydrogenase (quinone)